MCKYSIYMCIYIYVCLQIGCFGNKESANKRVENDVVWGLWLQFHKKMDRDRETNVCVCEGSLVPG